MSDASRVFPAPCDGEMVLPAHLIEVPHYACRACGAHGRPGLINGTWSYYDGHHQGCPYQKDAATYVPLEIQDLRSMAPAVTRGE